MGQFMGDDPPDKLDGPAAEGAFQRDRSTRPPTRRHANGDRSRGAVGGFIVVHDEGGVGHQVVAHEGREGGDHLDDVCVEPSLQLKGPEPVVDPLPHGYIVRRRGRRVSGLAGKRLAEAAARRARR